MIFKNRNMLTVTSIEKQIAAQKCFAALQLCVETCKFKKN